MCTNICALSICFSTDWMMSYPDIPHFAPWAIFRNRHIGRVSTHLRSSFSNNHQAGIILAWILYFTRIVCTQPQIVTSIKRGSSSGKGKEGEVEKGGWHGRSCVLPPKTRPPCMYGGGWVETTPLRHIRKISELGRPVFHLLSKGHSGSSRGFPFHSVSVRSPSPPLFPPRLCTYQHAHLIFRMLPCPEHSLNQMSCRKASYGSFYK